MPIVTEQEREFFRRNGYVKLSQIVPKENVDRVIEAIWAFMGKDPEDVDGWYTPPEGMTEYWKHQGSGMVELYQHQSLWDNRQHPKVYEAFADILGEEKLWVSIDRVNMTPPSRPEYSQLDYGFIHWDVDTAHLPSPLPKPYGVQGVLYLADTSDNQGGFQCVPSIYRDFEQWLETQPADRDPRIPDLQGHPIEVIPGKAGDLLIWDRLLPHGNGRNFSDKPRFAQYITMQPAKPGQLESRRPFVESWRGNRTPPWFPGDPRGWEEKRNGKPAELTELGRKLLGLESW